MSKDTGGPAFPLSVTLSNTLGEFINMLPGMTLCDLFAAVALAGMLADPGSAGTAEMFAKRAYNYADAMLVERAKE